MISGREIARNVANDRIKISPFHPSSIQPHSYDLRLGSKLVRVVCNNLLGNIDTHIPGNVQGIECTDGYFTIYPGELYLGHTIETIGSNYYVPVIHGRSTAARQGVMVHFAGLCDAGWFGEVTLEIVNMTSSPMNIYPGDRVCQVTFDTIDGSIDLYESTYQGQTGPTAAKSLGD